MNGRADMSLDQARGRLLIHLLVLLDVVLSCPDAVTQDVLTARYNYARTGSTFAGINTDSFRNGWHKVGDLHVDGRVYAQPLVVNGVETAPGVRHNVVYIATEHNHLYAFDADMLAPIWDRFLGNNDRTKMGSAGCDGISPDGIGIEATPVIDRNMLRVYVSFRVNEQEEPDTAYQELVALDIRNGQIVGGPVEVRANGFLPQWERSRASLLLQNGQVYVAFASRCEDPGMPIFHGFIFAYDAISLAMSGEFPVTRLRCSRAPIGGPA